MRWYYLNPELLRPGAVSSASRATATDPETTEAPATLLCENQPTTKSPANSRYTCWHCPSVRWYYLTPELLRSGAVNFN